MPLVCPEQKTKYGGIVIEPQSPKVARDWGLIGQQNGRPFPTQSMLDSLNYDHNRSLTLTKKLF